MSQPTASSFPCNHPINYQDRELVLSLVSKGQGVKVRDVLSDSRLSVLVQARQVVGTVLLLAGDTPRRVAAFLHYDDPTTCRRARDSHKDDPAVAVFYRQFLEERKKIRRDAPDDVRNFLNDLFAELPAPYNECAKKFVLSDVLGDYAKPGDSYARFNGCAVLRCNRDLSRRIANMLLVREGPGAAQRMRKAVGLAA